MNKLQDGDTHCLRDVEFIICALWCGVLVSGLWAEEFRVYGAWFIFMGCALWSRLQGLGFGNQGLCFRVGGVGIRVYG